MGTKKDKTATALFANYSRGIETGRDAWCYNASRVLVAKNMWTMIEFYNSELTRFNLAYVNASRKDREKAVDSFINTDPSKISWSLWLKGDLAKGEAFAFAESC